MNVFTLDINTVELIVLHYNFTKVSAQGIEIATIEDNPENLLKKVLSDDFEYKNIRINKVEFFDKDDNLIADSFTWTYEFLVDFLKSRILLDANLEPLHKGDSVEFIKSGNKGIINNLGVGKTKKLVSIMIGNHIYTALPKNIRKIPQDLLKEKETERIDLLDAPYFIKIDIDGRYYSYACFDKVSVGDYVMVTGRAEHMIHKVREVIPNCKMINKNIVTQEVKCVCHFDFAAYENRIIQRQDKKIINEFNNILKNVTTMSEIEVLENILNNKKQELQNVIKGEK